MNFPSRSDLQRLWPYLTPSQRRSTELLLQSQERYLRNRTKRKAAQDFLGWCKATSPGFNFEWPHLRFVTEKLQALAEGTLTDEKGRRKDRLALSMPPRHGKTETATVRFPAWNLCQRTTDRVILGGHTQRLANLFSRKVKRLVKGEIDLSREVNGAAEWETTDYGGLLAVGVGVGISGRGANLAGIDDPIKSRKDANSAVYRDTVWDWLRDDFLTRLEPGASAFLIMTRWHHDDPVGRLEKSEDADRWLFINLPALAGEEDPLGRQPGEALCPDRYDEAALLRLRALLGHSFESLFQGNPTPLEGSVFNVKAFRQYDEPPVRPIMVVQSWDCANKGQQWNDYSICTTWAVTRDGAYLLHVYREQVNYPRLKEAAVTLAQTFRPNAVLIEDKGAGQQLIQELRSNTKLPVTAFEPEGDKIVRAMAEALMVQAGLVHLPARAAWLSDFLSELSEFPQGAYDDQVDSVSQFLKWLRSQSFAVAFEAMGVPRAGVEAWEVEGAGSDGLRATVGAGFGRLRSGSDYGGY